ncbi:MAG TPA: hypothetical protein VLX92_10770 [Kofleriaceae bacterium]|nr:hypothetical protein [Kofleriaceae bacterium]
MRLAVVAWLLVGCHPYIAAGYDPSAAVHGPLATTMTAPSAQSYDAAIGGGARDFTVELGLHAHEVSSQSFALPSATMTGPRYLTSSASFDVTWTWLRWHHLSSGLHAGPAAMMLLDRTTGAVDWGKGVRYGARVGVTFSIVTAFVDFSRTAVGFDGGVAQGFSDVTGLMVGLELR